MNFLDHYFTAVYNKLEADALLFNRKLPHAGLVGSENELALADLLRSFLPPRFGVEVSGIVIDRHGNESCQCDIIIYDSQTFPSYLRKVFPVELVYGVIEVKTNLTSSEAKGALKNLESVWKLDFRPELTPFWIGESRKEGHQAEPPFGAIFAYRSKGKRFSTFASWFPFDSVFRGVQLRPRGDSCKVPEIRSLIVTALDKGLISMDSTNGNVRRWLPVAVSESASTLFEVETADSEGWKGREQINPAKSLFIFLESLWVLLDQHRLHPGFDIRSYLSYEMSAIVEESSDEEAPPGGYAP